MSIDLDKIITIDIPDENGNLHTIEAPIKSFIGNPNETRRNYTKIPIDVAVKAFSEYLIQHNIDNRELTNFREGE